MQYQTSSYVNLHLSTIETLYFGCITVLQSWPPPTTPPRQCLTGDLGCVTPRVRLGMSKCIYSRPFSDYTTWNTRISDIPVHRSSLCSVRWQHLFSRTHLSLRRLTPFRWRKLHNRTHGVKKQPLAPFSTPFSLVPSPGQKMYLTT